MDWCLGGIMAQKLMQSDGKKIVSTKLVEVVKSYWSKVGIDEKRFFYIIQGKFDKLHYGAVAVG